MTKTYTEQAIAIVERQLKVAAQDLTPARNRGINFTVRGYILLDDGRRIGKAEAIQTLAAVLEQEDQTVSTPAQKQPRRSDFTWDRLNEATHEFFFRLCEDIQTYTKDAGMTSPAPLDQLRIGLTNAPRLSNLKKAGLVISVEGAKKSHKWLRLTDSGRQLFLTTIGHS
jgi:hypothetical protein